ncbi:putative Tripeptidyl-peptidase precursor [Triangularia verruculosa]|uniref:tripeptidyl-peptidase II n=1 Tax=Triangularia verruculosa TaxID=2587418 RepID=A0AAN6XR36_9PEZI|nr:putative Tripeptidyl-peptidase precursor [Triangularia verruculosa]
MLPVLFLTLLSGAALTFASPSVILEKIESKAIPPGWSFDHNATATDKLTVTIALKEPGFADIKARLHQRQFGGSNNHLSREQIHTYLQPKKKNIDMITSWLRSSAGVQNVHVQGSLLSFEASARQVKDLFSADLKYYTYSSEDDDDDTPKTTALRALSYSIPSWLRSYIDFVHPITNFMPPRRGGRPPKKPSKPTATKKASSSTAKPSPTKKTTSTSTKRATSTTIKKASTTTKKASSTSTRKLTTTTSKATTTSRPIGIPTIPTALPQETGPSDPEEPYEGNYPCLVATSPRCIKQLYNITYPPYNPSTAPRSPSNFGVAGFLEQWILHTDVTSFLSQYQPNHLSPTATPTGPYNFTVELINGGINPQHSPSNAGIEASLDVEYAMALGYPTNVIYYVTGGRGTKLSPSSGNPLPPLETDNEPYLEFLTALLAKSDPDLPHVLSISYADDEFSVPLPYAHRVCDLFAALAARGVSTFVATGDGGAAGTGQTRCLISSPSPQKMYIPTFPASCPYVTAVGAVDNVAPPFVGESFSAGGFSNYFSRPAFQDDVVIPYLSSLLTKNSTLFNATGRATPDISAIGSGFQIIMAGEMTEVLGTSASTPVVAAMVALVNDARMRAGKPSLGWLNPILYSEKVKAVLRDVTEGESYGCLFPDGSTSPGWPAVPGYDCITGLGAVRQFDELMAALL